MKTIGKITTVVLLLIASMLIYGFAIQKLWFWFITPLFNIPPLSLVQAYGIYLFVSIFKIKDLTVKKNEPEGEELWRQMLKGVAWLLLNAATSVFLGWLIMRLFM